MKPEVLKKHHFWILAGVGPFLTLLAVIFVFTDVGGTIDAKQAEIDTQLKDVTNTKPSGTKALADWDDQKKVLGVQREKLWKHNYEQQKSLFSWPGPHPLLDQVAAKYTKFGEPMKVENNEFQTFVRPEIYEAAYTQAASTIKPTTFPGGTWRGGRVFRYVSDWGVKVPKDRQIWLALEDLWVQRALLEPIAAVNADAANFTLVGDPKTTPPLKRSFTSRIWQVDLEIPTTGPYANKFILAKLKNRTDRLQNLGRGNTLRLKIKLSDGGQPIDYQIQADFVKAGQEIEVKVPIPLLQGIPPGTDVQKIVSVMQVLDELTVPIRRLDDISLGYKDARHVVAALKPPTWWPPSDAPVAAGPSGPAGPGGEVGAGGPAGPPGGRAGRGAAGTKIGGPESVLEANKDRYLDATGQVRRMPVGLVIVVDQMYMQDALVAFSNSALRFQITQFHWKRFRGSLGTLSPTDSGSDPGSAGPTGGSGEGPIGGRGLGGGGPLGGPGFGPSGPGFGPSGPGFGPSGPGSSGGTTSSSIDARQVTSGLVELSIYGIVTLYEKYVDSTDANSTTTLTTPAPTSESPAPMGNPPAPMGNTPAPMGNTPAPMGNTPAPMGNTPAPMGNTPAPMGNTPPKM